METVLEFQKKQLKPSESGTVHPAEVSVLQYVIPVIAGSCHSAVCQLLAVCFLFVSCKLSAGCSCQLCISC